MSEKVLLIDDDAAIREIMSLSIADLGYEIETAADGESALKIFEQLAPSIVLTDIKMPGMDGIEVLKRIKAINPDTEVIMISGHGDMDLAIKSLQYEALDFITKPIRDELLINALKRATERITMRRQIREHTQNLERIVKEKSAKLVELERQIAVGQAVESLSTAMRSLVESLVDGPSYFNELPCFISIHNRFLEVVAANQLSKERLGDLVGKQSWEAYAGRMGSGNACPVWMTITQGKGQRSKETLQGKDGQEIPVIVHTAPIFNKDREVELVIEISVDISEVKRLQEELRAAREKYQRLFDAVPHYVAVLDREFNLIEANRRFRNAFGDYKSAHCHETFRSSDTVCPHCPAELTFLDGESHQTETVVVTKAGSKHNVLIHTAPVHNEHGEIEQVMEIATDITQIRALQDHLSSLGLMLGSMSHGVKGLLTALDGGIYIAEAGFRKMDEEKVQEGWAIVRDKVGRIKKMVLDILYYAKSREIEYTAVDLSTFAGDLAGIIRPKAEQQKVRFDLQVEDGVGSMDMDETAMTSAIVNFLENAVDACAEDASKGSHVVSLAVRGDGDKVRLTISDNGMGVDKDARERMFTLFFSSKGTRGTGLGLFVSNQIIEQHKGVIDVQSAPGVGTTIEVIVPRLRPEQT